MWFGSEVSTVNDDVISKNLIVGKIKLRFIDGHVYLDV